MFRTVCHFIDFPRTRLLSVVAAFVLLLALALLPIGCGTQTPSAESDEQAGLENGVTDWPVVLQTAQGTLEMYQPQPESLTGNILSARAAVSLRRQASSAPIFGAVWFRAQLSSDRDTRTAVLDQITVTEVAFHDSTSAEERDFGQAITAQMSATSLEFPLDQLMASLDTARQEHVEDQRIRNTPPQIILSTAPATLISVNGEPRLQEMNRHPGVSRVANTPFILLMDDNSRHYFLKAGARWVSSSELSGPWTDAANVPPAIAAAGTELATPATQPTSRSATSGVPQSSELAPLAADAKIIVTTQPSELIVTNGVPQFTELPGGAGGELLYASNTSSDVLLDQADQNYYVLLSGRWYCSKGLQGPWQYVASTKLPAAFAQIPSDSAKADVLPFVAQTAEAHEAVLDAHIPQTAYIRRDAGASLTVAYDGTPQFADVAASPGVAYAVNTPEDVLRVNGLYYCCHQAVWYQSNSPNGPWTVCTQVPPAIYTLPPSCPDYNVRYVYVYDSYPDFVTEGYLPGYTGTYIDDSSIVYGTGYDYPGWYGSDYFPPACTWGFDACYDPFACEWGFDGGLYWGGADWFCHPWHEGWWRDHPGEHFGWHRWWGQGGFIHSRDIRGNFAGAHGNGAFRGYGNAALTARLPGEDHGGPGWHNLYARGGNASRNLSDAQQRSFTQARVAQGVRGNIFAGSDGRVFRSSNSGWEEHNASGWSRLGRVPEAGPEYRGSSAGAYSGRFYEAPAAGLNQHYAARANGNYRSSAVRSFGSGGNYGGGGGGYRGGGGGYRGGGGGFHGGGGGFHGGGGGGHR